MNNKVRWGVIGCGGIAARRTIPEYQKMSSCGEIVAVMDLAPGRAREVAKKFNIPRSCDSEKELLDQE
ncbi:MAG: Gfo/Idh/MocA family oxidoreductase, partial [Kiritimatiellia bacterium]|nr:Gfo/Idh/MocA family oxidoreductase [Kiritimatiellia bacterium]